MDVIDTDHEHRASAETLFGLREEETHLVCRLRLEDDLDRLVADGALTDEERARFGADQGSEHLARLLRSYEQAGHQPLDVLREAVLRRSLTDAISVAQTVAARIHKDGLLPVPFVEGPPDRSPQDRAGYLAQLDELLADRRAELADEVAAEPPSWAVTALGQAPDAEAEPEARQAWLQRAGVIATYREATGWTNPDLPIGRCPGVHSPEGRAAWHAAYSAAGRPEERRPEAEMTDGRLLVRARAAERARQNAPEAVYDAQREAHQNAATAEAEAVLARATGRHEAAAQLELQALLQSELAAQLDEAANSRGEHLAYYAETYAAGDAALIELRGRGVDPATVDDRVSAEDWLAAEREARQGDDVHRTITEADVSAADQVDLDEAGASLDDVSVELADESTPASDTEWVSEEAPSADALAVEVHAASTRAQVELDDAAQRDSDASAVPPHEWDYLAEIDHVAEPDHATAERGVDAAATDHAEFADRSDHADGADYVDGADYGDAAGLS